MTKLFLLLIFFSGIASLRFSSVFTSSKPVENSNIIVNNSENTSQNEADEKLILFKIERSYDNFALFYKAHLLPKGGFDPQTPIEAYKINYDNEAEKLGISGLQWYSAYAYKIKQKKENSIIITLKALDQRKIEVYYSKEKCFALMLINNKIAKLRTIYIQVSDGLFTPQVEYIQFIGTELKTGNSIYEKVQPIDLKL